MEALWFRKPVPMGLASSSLAVPTSFLWWMSSNGLRLLAVNRVSMGSNPIIHPKFLLCFRRFLVIFSGQNRLMIWEQNLRNVTNQLKIQLECVRRHNRTVKGRYCLCRNTAKRRKLEFVISIEEYTELVSQPCYYCGGSLPEAGYGLDRIDNKVGYIKGNIRPCCKQCNRAKSTLTEPEFAKWLLEIAGKYLKIM